MLAFDDSIRVLSILLIFFGSAAVVLFAIYRLIRYRRISRLLTAVTLLALPPLSLIIVAGEIAGNLEVNPMIDSREQLVGRYSNGDISLKLNADGTYQATGLSSTTAGTWSNYDWNLKLSDSSMPKPRIITRNGHLCVAPYYDGANSLVGLLLKKEGK